MIADHVQKRVAAHHGAEKIRPLGHCCTDEQATVTWEWVAMALSVVVAFTGIGLAWLFYQRRPELPAQIRARIGGLHHWVEHKYFVDEGYDRAIVRPLWKASVGLYKAIDRVLVDTLLVEGFAGIARFGGLLVRHFQNGDLQRYAFFVLFGLSVTLLFLFAG